MSPDRPAGGPPPSCRVYCSGGPHSEPPHLRPTHSYSLSRHFWGVAEAPWGQSHPHALPDSAGPGFPLSATRKHWFNQMTQGKALSNPQIALQTQGGINGSGRIRLPRRPEVQALTPPHASPAHPRSATPSGECLLRAARGLTTPKPPNPEPPRRRGGIQSPCSFQPAGSGGPEWASEGSKATQQVSVQARTRSPRPKALSTQLPTNRAFQVNPSEKEKEDTLTEERAISSEESPRKR